MTPGVISIQSAGLFYRIHEYQHNASASSYGLEAAEKMQVEAERIFKTLIVKTMTLKTMTLKTMTVKTPPVKTGKKDFIVAVLPVLQQLSMKRIAQSIGAKKAEMAERDVVERITGYVLGGVCPLGQKKKLVTVIDKTAMDHLTIFVSAGRRGMEIEIKPVDLAKLTSAQWVDIIQS